MYAGAGIGWLYPLVDGAPAVGWEMAARYLVLPALLVGAQYASSAITSPPVNPDDDSAKTTKVQCPRPETQACTEARRAALRTMITPRPSQFAAYSPENLRIANTQNVALYLAHHLRVLHKLMSCAVCLQNMLKEAACECRRAGCVLCLPTDVLW